MTSDVLKNLQRDIAETEALLDKAQVHYDTHKHLWTEEMAWNFQAEIDRKRFELAGNKLIVNLLTHRP